MTRRTQVIVLLTAFVLVAAACGSDSDETSAGAGRTGAAITVPQVESSPSDAVPSALEDPRNAAFPEPLLDPDELISGGPPPDGIPSIDEPRFLRPGDVDFLEDDEPVLSLQVGDEARAYPIQVLIWHEIVNDTVGGVPVTVTYCPLCNSAIAYDRRFGDRVLDFGTSGLLYNSALVMYDRQTESLWSHFTAEAIIGHLTGSQLDVFPVATVSWSDWRDANPDGLVLSRETGFDRQYGSNPYPGYDDIDSSPFLFEGEVDGRLAAKERVIGIEVDDTAVAVRLEPLSERGVLDIEVGDRNLVVWVEAGTRSALDSGAISEGRDVGATGVFDPAVDGRQLSFEPADDGFTDEETGSRWNVLGQAVRGPLEGTQLEAIAHVDTFWFAWGAFQPDTRIEP